MAMLDEARHRYYRRIGSAFMPMDHSMVGDMFGRGPRPVLRLELRPENPANLSVQVTVTNVGRGVARAPYLLLRAAKPLEAVAMDSHAMGLHRGTPGWYSFGEGMNSVIHPGLARQWIALRSSLATMSDHQRKKNLVDATRDGRLGISATTLGEQMKQFFEPCSRELLAFGDVRGAERFGRATTHWLRHTSASHALASGDVPLVAVKELLGHASLNTTSAYVTTEQRQRMAAVQRFARRRSALP